VAIELWECQSGPSLQPKPQSRNDLGEIPAGSLNLSQTPCGSQGKNAQQTRRSKLVGLNRTEETLRLRATRRAIAEFRGTVYYIDSCAVVLRIVFQCVPSLLLEHWVRDELRRSLHFAP
jgi:hypothetical protein